MVEQPSLPFRLRGGRRKGAGRKPRDPHRPNVPHRRRAPHSHRWPAHVTLRADRRIPSLRKLRRAIATAIHKGRKANFRVIEFSIQPDHLHLMTECDDRSALSRGVQGLKIRLARGINDALGRKGNVWADRYHDRPLRTPSEVRNCLVYILRNYTRSGVSLVGSVDPCSSAPWFSGFVGVAVEQASLRAILGNCPVSAAQTWLATVGWRKLGAIEPAEVPKNAG